MILSDISIKRPVFATMLNLVLVVFGLFALPEEASPDEPWARRLAVVVAALDVLFVVSAFLAFRQIRSVGLLYGVPFSMEAALAVPLLGVPLALVLPVFVVKVWRRGVWSWLWRVWFTLVVGAEVGFVAFLHHWNLLGFRF